jgi:hypothetical protein
VIRERSCSSKLPLVRIIRLLSGLSSDSSLRLRSKPSCLLIEHYPQDYVVSLFLVTCTWNSSQVRCGLSRCNSDVSILPRCNDFVQSSTFASLAGCPADPTWHRSFNPSRYASSLCSPPTPTAYAAVDPSRAAAVAIPCLQRVGRRFLERRSLNWSEHVAVMTYRVETGRARA